MSVFLSCVRCLRFTIVREFWHNSVNGCQHVPMSLRVPKHVGSLGLEGVLSLLPRVAVVIP